MGQSCQEFHFQEVEKHYHHCLLLQSSRANVYVETLLEDFWKNHTKYEIKTIKKLNKNYRKKAESLFTLQSSRANGYVETLRVFWKNHTTYNEMEEALITTVYLFNRAEQMCMLRQYVFKIAKYVSFEDVSSMFCCC